MTQLEHRAQIVQVEEECSVVIANTPALIRECLRLRYQVYCVEKGYEPGHNGLETDAFDDRARHVLLTHRSTGESVGTVRVIPPLGTRGLDSLPMTAVCAPGLLDHLPARTTGEISRFAISKQRRLSTGASTMLRLALMQGILRVSGDLGLTHWCAIMEPVLLRLQQRNAIHFDTLGSLIEYHGLRQPSCADIGKVLNEIKFRQWDVWDYITIGGTLWPTIRAWPEKAPLEFV